MCAEFDDETWEESFFQSLTDTQELPDDDDESDVEDENCKCFAEAQNTDTSSTCLTQSTIHDLIHSVLYIVICLWWDCPCVHAQMVSSPDQLFITDGPPLNYIVLLVAWMFPQWTIIHNPTPINAHHMRLWGLGAAAKPQFPAKVLAT